MARPTTRARICAPCQRAHRPGCAFIPFHFRRHLARQRRAAPLSAGARSGGARRGGKPIDHLRLRRRHPHAGNQGDRCAASKPRFREREHPDMARMKFLCDAERCIDCNACVTACKNEHEVPWGLNRRRVVTLNDGSPGELSVSMACMHCTDAPCASVARSSCFMQTADGHRAAQQGHVHRLRVLLLRLPRSARRNTRKRRTSAAAARWTNARLRGRSGGQQHA